MPESEKLDDVQLSDFSRPILKSGKLPQIAVTIQKTPRLFLRESGWKILIKPDHDRLFCYMTYPGETHYHRIVQGEIYLVNDDEKICLPCAERRGLLGFEPYRLSEPDKKINFLLDQLGDDEMLRLLRWDDEPQPGSE